MNEYWERVFLVDVATAIKHMKSLHRKVDDEPWSYQGAVDHYLDVNLKIGKFKNFKLVEVTLDDERGSRIGFLPYVSYFPIIEKTQIHVMGESKNNNIEIFVDLNYIKNRNTSCFSNKMTDAQIALTFSGVVDVVGIPYHNGKTILSGIARDKGELWNVGGVGEHNIFLTIEKEPENIYDENAIAVLSDYETPKGARNSRSGLIGYIPREVAKNLIIENSYIVPAVVRENGNYISVKVDLGNMQLKIK